MEAVESQRPKEWEDAVSASNAAVETLDIAKEVSSVTPAKAMFSSVSVVLTMIRVPFWSLADQLRAAIHPRRDDQPGGLHRTRASLC